MKVVNKIILFLLFIIISNKILTQNNEIFICENKRILISNEITFSNFDTIQHFRISKISILNGCIYTEATSSILFKNDSLIGSGFDRNYNYGRKITDSLNINCKEFKSISINEINITLGNFITKVLDLSEKNIYFNYRKAKQYLDILQQILLIIEDEKLDFLNEFCMYNNLDLNSLESIYWDAKYKNDKHKIFLLAQAYRINKYDINSKIDFNIIWFELYYELNYNKKETYFTKKQLKQLKCIFKTKDSIYQLNKNCWYGYL